MMKKSSLLMIAAVLILSSCGMASKYTSGNSEARFQDGIYNSAPSFRSKEDKAQDRAATDALVEETKASQIYLFGEKKDSIIIPESMSASIRYDKSLASTVVTVGENPYAWQNNIDPWYYYTPYSIGSSWYWSRHYDPWYGNAWYWNTWAYSPWSHYGWYDPWYYGGFYDPWYYGGYYGYMYPHYYGWYGGWDPYYWGTYHHHYYPTVPIRHEDRWHGERRQTGSDRVFTSRVSTRGGIANTSRVSRTASAQSSTTSRASASSSASSGRTTVTRVTAPSSNSAANRQPATTVDKTVKRTVTRTTVANHRKPVATSTRPSSNISGGSAGRTPTSTSYRSTSGSSSSRSSYGTSSSSSSSSSYRSSSSSTPTRSSSFSSGSSSRSYSGGGTSSGASRSGGSSGGRR